jgi:hypothetical protein
MQFPTCTQRGRADQAGLLPGQRMPALVPAARAPAEVDIDADNIGRRGPANDMLMASIRTSLRISAAR